MRRRSDNAKRTEKRQTERRNFSRHLERNRDGDEVYIIWCAQDLFIYYLACIHSARLECANRLACEISHQFIIEL